MSVAGPPNVVGDRQRFVFLIFNVDGGGGVARTTVNLANALAETYDVEIISVYRRPSSRFQVDARVKVTHLVGFSASRKNPPARVRELASMPSELVVGDKLSRLTDKRMRAAFARMRPGDVLVSTRPSLHIASAELAPDHVIRIGWDHLIFPTRYGDDGAGGRSIGRAMPKLDAFVVLTKADARDYQATYPSARIQAIPNSLGWEPATVRPPRQGNLVVAAGRLSPIKGFDLLIEAWSSLAEEFPDWTCRIYGTGESRDLLAAQIEAADVPVELAGYSPDMRDTFAHADVCVMSSRAEGFGMTLIEAASQGTPLVSFDCPRGPGEIIVNGSNGLLVPEGDVGALAKALADLMRDAAARARMGEQALEDSRCYTPARVAGEWRALVEELVGERRG